MRGDAKYILALLSRPSGRTTPPGESENTSVAGRTRLQKIMYTASRAYAQVDYGFKPYKHGMYSKRLNNALNEYAESGLVCMPDGDGWPIHLTKAGLATAKSQKYDTGVCEALVSMREFLGGMSYGEMIAFTYTKYPEMKERSEILGYYEENRAQAAVSLHQQGKVSLSLAVEISGMPPEEFEDMLDDNGMPLYPPAHGADDAVTRARVA